MVNSGGVKLFPEAIEKKIAHLIDRRFYLTGEEDERLGSQLVLKIEGDEIGIQELEKLRAHISESVGKYEQPRKIIFVQHFQETRTGKVKRT